MQQIREREYLCGGRCRSRKTSTIVVTMKKAIVLEALFNLKHIKPGDEGWSSWCTKNSDGKNRHRRSLL